MKHFKQARRFGSAVVIAALATPAMAAIDTTAVISSIGETNAAVAVIGSAVLVVAIGIKTWKWLKSAL